MGRRAGLRSRGGLRRLPLLAVVPILVAALWVTVAPPYTNGPPIRSDGLGYYAWTEAILQGDARFCQWSAELDPVNAISARNPRHPQRCELRYTPGLALLRLPVMAPAALAAEHGQSRKLTVGPTEERESQWLGVAALLLTALLVGAALRRLRVPPWLADLTVLAATFGSGLFHYATYDSSYSHIYSAALFAGLVLLGVDAVERDREPKPWLAFILCLFIVFIREPDVVPLLVLVAAFIASRVHTLPPTRRRRAALSAALPALAAILAVVAFQLLYSHWSGGSWSLSSYGQEQFSPGELAELKVLIAYDHGLFVWYPVLAVLLGAAVAARRSRGWGAVALAAVGALTLVYGSWPGWDLGGAFGLRGFVDVVPVIAVAGGLGLATLRPPTRWLVLVGATLCVIVTLELMSGYWSGALPFGGDTGHQYWREVVGANSLLAG